jgi:hypothetical protein
MLISPLGQNQVEGANMIEKMIASILNKTAALEDYGSDDHIYFVKEEGFMEEEITNLKYVDISERHIEPYGKEICIQAAKTKRCGLSGVH